MATAYKTVDTVYYEYQGIEDPDADKPQVAGKKVPVKVQVRKKLGDSEKPPRETIGMEFRLECEDPKFSMEGPDISVLWTAAREKLDKEFAIKWENWYLVNLHPTSVYDGSGTAIEFVYKMIEKGIAHDGTELLREARYRTGDLIRPWPGEFRDRGGRLTACIPYSAANREALDEFAKKIDSLRERLADMVRPQNIQRTLAIMSGFALLAIEGEMGDSEGGS